MGINRRQRGSTLFNPDVRIDSMFARVMLELGTDLGGSHLSSHVAVKTSCSSHLNSDSHHSSLIGRWR